MNADDYSSRDAIRRRALIHRENLQLGLLILAAIAAFVVTRALAANNREMTVRDAAEWFSRGQAQMARGDVGDAVDSFRRATVRDRGDKRYGLALARALMRQHDDDGARGTLQALRESTPEDPDVNLDLARLAAQRRDVPEALRFYRNALYAPWPSDQAGARREVRLELARFLLAEHDTSRAQAELLALVAEMPDDPALHREVGSLFAASGDPAHALDQFRRAIALTPTDALSLAGAGKAAFALGNYPLALTYLQQLPGEATDANETREIVMLVLSNDPLTARIGSSERRRRFVADLAYARDRLQACLDRPAGPAASSDVIELQADAERLSQTVTATKTIEQDALEAGMDLVDRVEREAVRRCGPTTPMDQALTLIGQRHGAGAK